MKLTTNYGLKKPEGTDVVNIDDFNDNADVLDAKVKILEDVITETKKSVSDGKTLLAAAITAKRVAAAATDTFAQLAAKIGQIILGSGNATAADVLASKTFTNSTGVEQTGTMVNRGAVSQALNAGGSYTVPSGYHNGSGTVAANSLASQTSATAIASQILAGITAWVNGIKITGSMSNQGAVSQSLTINGTYTVPAGYHNGSGKVTQSITTKGAATYTPGTAAQVIAGGQYLSDAQTISAVSNLSAANIKKGVVVGGVTGTWEGYVATATDLYYLGVNNAGLTVTSSSSTGRTIAFESTFIRIYTSAIDSAALITAGKSYQFAGFSKVNVQFYVSGTATNNSGKKITVLSGSSEIGSYDIFTMMQTVGTYTISFSLTAWQTNVTPTFGFELRGGTIQVQRIWLS